jgi:hypothetical protein
MMHPTISEALAKSRQQQFRREAEQWRLARRGGNRRGGRPCCQGPPATAAQGRRRSGAVEADQDAAGRQCPLAQNLSGGFHAGRAVATTVSAARRRAPASRCPPRTGASPPSSATVPGGSAHRHGGTAPAGRHAARARPRHRQSRPGYRVSLYFPARGMTMCQHQPPCPPAGAPDRAAARALASHPEQGWSLLCNRVVLFDDGGELLPGGRAVEPSGPLGETGIQPSWSRSFPVGLQIIAAIPRVDLAHRRVHP